MTERFFVAIGGHGWGKGLSAAEAKREARRHCQRGTKLDVYKLPAGAHSVYVDELGGIRWKLQDTTARESTAELVESKGRRLVTADDDDDGVAEWQEHVAKQKAQRASAKEQGA
jgi:hypothetical protein